MVLKSMELLKEYGSGYGRFDPWLNSLERALDGRGKMGSMVGASKDLRFAGMAGNPDTHLMEYAVRGHF